MGRLSKAKAWSKRVRSFESSGLSQRAWCERHGLSKSSLSYWQRRMSKSKPALVPIVVTSDRTAAPADGALEIEVGGVVLRVSTGVDATWLCAVLRGLR